MLDNLYKHIAKTIIEHKNLINKDDYNNRQKKLYLENKLKYIQENLLPYRNDIDNGHIIDIDNSNKNKLIIYNLYKLSNKYGKYIKLIKYKIIIKPSLLENIDIDIIGKFGKYKSIKQYLVLVYYKALDELVIVNY